MKGETAAEGDMKAGIDFTETGPAVVMAEDKGHTVEAEAHTMTREGTMLAEAAAEIYRDNYDRYERRDSRDRKEL